MHPVLAWIPNAPCNLLVLGAVVAACATHADDAPLPTGSSTVLGTATATAAIVLDDTDVVWFSTTDSTTILESCPKTGCRQPTVLLRQPGLSLSDWRHSPAVIAQGAVYFIADFTAEGPHLQSCPLAGCDSPTVLAPVAANSQLVTDGNWLAYQGANGEVDGCALPACQPETLFSGTIFGTGSTFTLAGGMLYLALNQQAILSCSPRTCASNAFNTVWQSNELLLSGILGVDDNSAYLLGANYSLVRCDLPVCRTLVDMGAPVLAANSTVQFAGSDLYVYTGSSWIHCTQDRCDSSALSSPDAVLASLCPAPDANGPQQLGTLPFAVDAANFYWATSSIYRTPGNLIVSTPR